MIKHNGEWYGWNAVYLISGLCAEDFTHDSVGSWEHFINALKVWEGEPVPVPENLLERMAAIRAKAEEKFDWNEWYADRDIYGNEEDLK